MDAILANLPPIIAAIGTFLAAAGALIVALRNASRADRAADAAEAAALAAHNSEAQIMVVGKDVVEVGKRIDGRLTQLLAATAKASYAEGQAAGPNGPKDEPA